MTKQKISAIVDNSFSDAFEAFESALKNELYPAAFANEYSWLRVKGALSKNNVLLKNAIKQALMEILTSDDF